MKRPLTLRAHNQAKPGSPEELDIIIPDPTEADVDRVLDKCQHVEAVVDIFDKTNRYHMPILALWGDGRRYLLLLTEIAEGENTSHVHSLTNPNPVCDPEAPKGMALMHGDCFAAEDIVTDFDQVRRACKEFVRTGGETPEDMLYPEERAAKQ